MPRWQARAFVSVDRVLRRPGDQFEATRDQVGVLPDRGLVVELKPPRPKRPAGPDPDVAVPDPDPEPTGDQPAAPPESTADSDTTGAAPTEE